MQTNGTGWRETILKALMLGVSMALIAGPGAFAAEFHVAPDGNDANPGTADKPFATIAKARDAFEATKSCLIS